MEDTKAQCHTNYVFDSTKSTNWPTVPTICEWEQLWASWDVVTTVMIDHNTMLFEQPIGLRHPFIFYIGHVPAFLDIMITRHHFDRIIEKEPLTEPVAFADIFERGIDPDMDNPTICNPHSNVPNNESDWPSVSSILQYQKLVRNRLRRLLLNLEADKLTTVNRSNEGRLSHQRTGRVICMCFEHEAMHLETLLYMLVQSPNLKYPPVSPPSWFNKNCLQNETASSMLDRASIIVLEGGNVEIGHDDDEEALQPTASHFGWDNENPKRVVTVLPFKLQSRPVTNGEYWLFWKDTNFDQLLFPASWYLENNHEVGQLPKVKTTFGLCNFHSAINWPAQVSCQQAEAYAASSENGMRLPTEPEWIHFRRTMESQQNITDSNSQNFRNYGFMSWTPQPLSNQEVHIVGNVWEWTSTVWNNYEGFKPSKLYPGYSSDFFDGKHRVVLGASWATHPRIAGRISFRNWYQWRYPYVFCGFRLCKTVEVQK